MLRDISEFKIDQIARSYASKTKIALHGSYPSALSLNDLIRLSDGKPNPVDPDTPLSYAPSLGSKELRQRLAEIHSTPEAPLTENHVVITPGSIMANYL
ncbi:aspartate aminotransferase, partial [Colletotrichum sojae]